MTTNIQVPLNGTEAQWVAFSPADLTALSGLAKTLSFKSAKLPVFNQGDQARFCYVLVDGIVQVSRVLPDGERHVVAFHWPGDLFGMEENGLFINQAETLTPCIIYQISAETLHEFLLADPCIQQKVLVQAVHKLRAAQRQVIVVGRLDTHRALAAFLLDCSGHEKYFDNSRSVLTLPMSRVDIADYLGTAAESVTRALGRLEVEGLVRRQTARRLVLDIPAMRRLVNLD